MDSILHLLSSIGFLAMLLLAGAVVGATAWRQGMAGQASLNLGCCLFLFEFALFVALAGMGASVDVAQAVAVALGVIAVLGLGTLPRPESGSNRPR